MVKIWGPLLQKQNKNGATISFPEGLEQGSSKNA